MAVGAERHTLGLAEKAATLEFALSMERSALVIDREMAKEAVSDLEIARIITIDMEKELERLSKGCLQLKGRRSEPGPSLRLSTRT